MAPPLPYTSDVPSFLTCVALIFVPSGGGGFSANNGPTLADSMPKQSATITAAVGDARRRPRCIILPPAFLSLGRKRPGPGTVLLRLGSCLSRYAAGVNRASPTLTTLPATKLTPFMFDLPFLIVRPPRVLTSGHYQPRRRSLEEAGEPLKPRGAAAKVAFYKKEFCEHVVSERRLRTVVNREPGHLGFQERRVTLVDRERSSLEIAAAVRRLAKRGWSDRDSCPDLSSFRPGFAFSLIRTVALLPVGFQRPAGACGTLHVFPFLHPPSLDQDFAYLICEPLSVADR